MTKGIVVPAGGGKHYEEAPGRFFDLKLLADQTGQSIMLFEETVPAGTKSTHHLHHDSDEVVWVLEGEFTFKIGTTCSRAVPAPAPSCHAPCRTPGRTATPAPAARCSSTRRAAPASTSRRCASGRRH